MPGSEGLQLWHCGIATCVAPISLARMSGEWLWSIVGMIIDWERRSTGEKPVLLAPYPPQIPRVLYWNCMQFFALRSLQLVAWLWHCRVLKSSSLRVLTWWLREHVTPATRSVDVRSGQWSLPLWRTLELDREWIKFLVVRLADSVTCKL